VTAIHFFTLLGAAAASFVAIAVTRPWLRRYALAQPNARSSHTIPTPQGGGIAVVVATLGVAGGVLHAADAGLTTQLLAFFAATIVIAIVGAVDDLLIIEIAPRLLLQAVCVGILIATLPIELRLLPALPFFIERTLIFIGAIWFVNLVNFMDGIDWITVAEAVPVAGALAAFGFAGALPQDATIVALALCGAMIGFAPFNKPVARLFLGDVGSLPVGLLLAWLLVLLAGTHLTAALLLPLYYLADTTITLIRRIARGEKFLEAHRSHFYQQATDNGFSVNAIVARIFAVNLCLIALAATTLMTDSRVAHVAALAAGCAIVSWLLLAFSKRRPV